MRRPRAAVGRPFLHSVRHPQPFRRFRPAAWSWRARFPRSVRQGRTRPPPGSRVASGHCGVRVERSGCRDEATHELTGFRDVRGAGTRAGVRRPCVVLSQDPQDQLHDYDWCVIRLNDGREIEIPAFEMRRPASDV
jgi:hypothetical protein